MMVIFRRVMPPCAPNCSSCAAGRVLTVMSQKSAEEQPKGAVRAVLSSLSSPDISSFIHVCAAVWGFMNMPGRPFSCCKLHAQTSPVHSLIYIWQGFVYCIQVQNMILDIHKASSEFITQQLLQQIIPISSQKRNLWTALVLKERSFWKHILSQKKMKAKKLILT